LILLAVISSLVFLPFLGNAGMFDPTDSFFIESAREMLETHKFIVPLMNYEPWLDKPSTDFCLIALSLATFGLNEFAGRLVSALSGILECLALFWLSSRILTIRQSFLSALCLISFPLYVVVGRTALSDEPLSLALCVALMSLAIASIKRANLFLVPGYLALGLAILLKGPPLALSLTGLVLVGYLLATYRGKFIAAGFSLKPIQGLLAASAIALPYYVWAHIGTAGEFTTNFFFRQNLGRAIGTVNHVRPFWFYVPVLLAGTFPWGFMLCASTGYLRRVFVIAAESATDRQKLLKFAFIWSVLGLIFFSVVPTKLETYIVPVLPPIAIISGCFVDLLWRVASINRAKAKASYSIVRLLLIATTLAVIATPISIALAFDRKGLFAAQSVFGSLILLIGSLFSWIGLRKREFNLAIYSLLGAMVAFCAIFIPLFFLVYHKAYQEPIDRLVSYAQARHAHLAVVYFSLPSVIFRYHQTIPVIKNEQEMRSYAELNPDRQWLLINRDVLSLLSWTERSPRVVAHQGRWWLFAVGRNCANEGTTEWRGIRGHVYPTLDKFNVSSGLEN
jgi:4-amino-4-deoxy-L-arabinose transferase-like glycosyltransferase